MLDPSKIQESVQQLQQLLESLSENQLETTLRGLRTAMGSLQQQLAQSEQIRDNLAAVQRGITNNVSSLTAQKNQTEAQLRAVQAKRTTVNQRLQQSIKDAYKTGDISAVLRAEERRLRILDAYAAKTRGIRSTLAQQSASLRASTSQLGRVNTLYTNQQNTITRIIGLLGTNRTQQTAIQTQIQQQNQAARTFSQILGISTARTVRLLNAVTSVRTAVFGIAKYAVQQLAGGFTEARKQGQSAGQAIETTVQGMGAALQGLSAGVIASPIEFTKNLAQLQDQLGMMSIPPSLTVEATRLTTQYGMSTEAAAGVVAQVQRLNRFQSQVTTSQIRGSLELARMKGVAPGALFKEIAKNTESMARYASQGLVAFANSAIELKKMGVEMSTVEGFADRLVDDYEGSLKLQAEIQTFAPGFDLSAVQQLSQFGGTPDQIAQALRGALQGAGLNDLSTLPRSIQNSITKGLGFSRTELSNLMAGKAPGADAVANVVPEEVAGFANSISNLATPALHGLAVAATLAATSLGGSALGNILKGRGAAAGAASSIGKIGAGRMLAAGALGAGAAGAISGYSQYQSSKAKGLDEATSRKNALIVGGGSTAGALGGMALGASIGSIIPGAGTLIGGAVGALVGMIGGVAGGKIAEKFTTQLTKEQQKTEDLRKKEEQAQQERIARMNSDLTRFSGTVLLTNTAMAQSSSLWSRLTDGMSSTAASARSGISSMVGYLTGEKKHSGGIVGRGTPVNIPRFHDGFMPDEVPAILQRGEAVLSKMQLGGLTNLMNIAKNFGKIGESFRAIRPESIAQFSKGLGNISQLFSAQGMGNMVGQTLGKMAGTKVGGALAGMVGKMTGNNGNVLNAVSGVLSGKTNIGSAISGLFGGGKGGGTGNMISGLLSKSGIGSKLTGLLGGKAGGIVGAASSLLKGDFKGAAGGLLKGGLAKLGGAKIGAALGSIIPGAGTAVGALLGTGISKLANTRIGKAVGNVLGKTPLGAGVKKIGGAAISGIKSIGSKLGGLFGKKKKTAAPVATAQTVEQVPDNQASVYLSQLAQMGGIGGMFGGQQPAPAPVVNVDLKPLENQLAQLISLMQNGGIAVNLDGKKVAGGIIDAYSRG